MEINQGAREYGERDNILDVAPPSGPSDWDNDPSVSDGSVGNIFDLVDAGFFGDIGNDLVLCVVPDEEDIGRPQVDSEELVYTPLSHLSDARKRRKRQQQTLSISEEDYEEGPEREAFLMLYERIRACYMKQTSPDTRQQAIKWVFSREDNGISFDLCCRALGVRPEILRLRLQYQFFLLWFVFPNPFPFLAIGIPDIIEGEILYRFGEEGFDIAKQCWLWPGVSRLDLLASLEGRFTAHQYQVAIEKMDQLGVLSEYGDRWYLTGRNPSVYGKNSATFRWSSLWDKS